MPHDRSRREFLAAAAGTVVSLSLPDARAQPASMTKPFAFEEATLGALAERMGRGEVTSKSLTQAYLERIAAVDRSGPQLRSMLETNPDALAAAEKLDAERRAGKVRGPLHGIPIVVKDNIATADRMATSAGSIAFAKHRAAADAPAIKRLRDAGAVILGKSNLSEWANFRSSNSLSGWSSRGGQTHNPYSLERTPSGSSSGSAAAAAANLCAAALGTETDGSITSPSACNNIVGFKPSIGLVSRTGVVPIAHSQDTIGPMTRTVEDCAALMNALAGADPADKATQTAGVPRNVDFTEHLKMGDLKGTRIGVARQYFGVNEKVDAILHAALGKLEETGAELVDVEFPHFGKFSGDELEVLLYEFKAGINAWLAANGKEGNIRSLAQLIAYNEQNKDRVMPIFGQNLFIRAEAKGPLTEKPYLDALANCRRMTRAEGIDAVVQKHRVAAIVGPTTSPPWLIDFVTGDSGRGGCTSMPAVAGYPHVTVPAGFIHPPAPLRGVAPVGLSFFGPAFSDARLLGIARVFEQATRHRKPPIFGA